MSEEEAEALRRPLVEALTRELVSSKSNDAVRCAAAACLEVGCFFFFYWWFQ